MEDEFLLMTKKKTSFVGSNLLLAFQFMFSLEQFCLPVQFLVPYLCKGLY